MSIPLQTTWKPGTKKIISLKWEAEIPDIHHRVGKDGGNYWFGNTLPILAAYDNGWKTNLLHEIAHQWFYNLIGNDQIKEPWIILGRLV